MNHARIFQSAILTLTVVGVAYSTVATSINRAAACTIVSGVAEDGQVWRANNNDGPAGLASFLNVFPRAKAGEYGYFTLSGGSPAAGEDSRIQGGMNEAGLTFDFNSLDKDRLVLGRDKKKAFPGGDAAILRHILATMTSTREVVEFFETYWFEKGFSQAQMHVADQSGCFALIGPSGSLVVDKGKPLVSTNFDIVGKEDGSTCWRYPIASRKLKREGASYATMSDICRETAQSGVSVTLYSNVQNLTTGDIWLFADREFDTPVKTTIADLLAKGRKSYSFDDLQSLVSGIPVQESKDTNAVPPQQIELPPETIARYIGAYRHPFGDSLTVKLHPTGIEVAGTGIPTEVFYPSSTNSFYSPKNHITLTFEASDDDAQMQMTVFEKGNRAFTTHRVAR